MAEPAPYRPLRWERVKRGLALWEIKRATGIDEPRLSRLERGIAIATPEEIDALATHYGVEPEDVFADDGRALSTEKAMEEVA